MKIPSTSQDWNVSISCGFGDPRYKVMSSNPEYTVPQAPTQFLPYISS